MSEINMTALHAAIAALNDRLSADGMGAEISAKHHDAPIRLLDEDGNGFAEIPVSLAQLLGTVATQADAVTIALCLRRMTEQARKSGYSAGRTAGRREICETVQELLGVDGIVKALYEIRGA